MFTGYGNGIPYPLWNRTHSLGDTWPTERREQPSTTEQWEE
ncbi:unnamed protein product [Angiostrongylus costaricensis]|uniref:Uncharacterized protein n=1 Tax=Angiostrongylus costaricensis TaxID=334426 RepID=A0A0R3PM89_ANGCS|nr:unnamed protein product [Angiostrongylus costaricensis]